VKLLFTGGCGLSASKLHPHVLATHATTASSSRQADVCRKPATWPTSRTIRGNTFVQGDVATPKVVRDVIRGVDAVVNFAAESHVDRSLMERPFFSGPTSSACSRLLEAVKELKIARFLNISTDEVYGRRARVVARERSGARRRTRIGSRPAGTCSRWPTGTPIGCRSLITARRTNFGPHQYPEKVIPLFRAPTRSTTSAAALRHGRNVRDGSTSSTTARASIWSCARGARASLQHGAATSRNIVLTRQILQLTQARDADQPVKDRWATDRRYSVDSHKVRQLGWTRATRSAIALGTTVAWYREHEAWCARQSRASPRVYEKQYGHGHR